MIQQVIKKMVNTDINHIRIIIVLVMAEMSVRVGVTTEEISMALTAMIIMMTNVNVIHAAASVVDDI